MPKLPDPQDTANLLQKTGVAAQKLSKWRQDYLQSTPNPSEQILFMTDNAIKKLQDDYQVIQLAQKNGLSLSEAAFRFSKLQNHFGLDDVTRKPLQVPQRRIRTALHSFDTLKMLQGNKKQSKAQAQRNEKLEGYKDTLLSRPSRAIFDADNNPKKAEQGGISL